MKKLRLKSLLALLTVSSLLLSSCGGGTEPAPEAPAAEAPAEAEGEAPAETNAEAPAGGELVIAIPDEMQGTDIQQIDAENIVLTLLYEPLIAFKLDLSEIVADQAESFEASEDGLTLTFNLIPGATFSNGKPITAEAVKAAYERYIELSPYNADWACVESIEAVDETTLVLHMIEPSAYFIPSLTSTFSGFVDPEAAAAEENDAFNRAAVTNGPYGVGEWVQGSHIELVRNDGYKTNFPDVENKGPAYFEKVTVRFIPESFTRVAELEAGTVDIIYEVPSENLESLQANPDIEISSFLQTGTAYMAINLNKAPFDDLKVRQAIAMAIDRDEITVALKDNVVPLRGYLSPAQICYDPEIENDIEAYLPFDVEQAKALLKEAGWEDTNGDGIAEKDGQPFNLTMNVPLDYPYVKMSSVLLQQQLKAIGINAELREFEMKYVRQSVEDGDFDLALRSYEWIDPDMLTYVFGTTSGYNWGTEELDAKLDVARTIMDTDERAAAYREIQNDVAGRLPAISLFADKRYLASRKEIKGFKLTTDGLLYINDMTKE